jgi:CRISPR-associated protein Cas5h
MGIKMKVLVFDLRADLGHFKVPYTTTSPLTLPIPSKTAIYGILGAIVGLDKTNYLESFQQGSCRVSIGIRKPVKKTHISENLINTKNVNKTNMFARMNSRKNAPRTQVKIEFLKDPEFRLYIHHQDEELLRLLQHMVMAHKSKYTVCLGLSECLANFTYVGFFDAEGINNNQEVVEYRSVLPMDQIDSKEDIVFDDERYYLRTHIPLEMNSQRELIKTGDFLIEGNGKGIRAKVNTYYQIKELQENILFF